MNNRPYACRALLSVLVFGLATSVDAGNAAEPNPIGGALDSVHVGPATCESLSFTGDELRIETANREIDFLTANLTFDGSMNLRIKVDPVSGPVGFLSNLVNIESGHFDMRGTNASLGIFNSILLIGRPIGVHYDTFPFFEILIDIQYVHPDLVTLVGPIRTMTYTSFLGPWFFGEPWEDDATLSPPLDCFTHSPQMAVYSNPVPPHDPITFEAEGPAGGVATACQFILADGQPITIQYTFDANTRDLDPDPNRGVYLSCDDSYGSREGVRIATGVFSRQAPCVLITVENDSPNGSPGTDLVDFYRVQMVGTSELTGTFVWRENQDGTAYSDDSLPSLPPTLGFGPGEFSGVSGINSIFLDFDGVCEIEGGLVRLDRIGDADFDFVPDSIDNCTLHYNPTQRDLNGDGFGNVCDPDLDNNGIVNVIDLGLLKSVFFTAGELSADLDGDGHVNVVDLGILKALFFMPPGPSGLEP